MTSQGNTREQVRRLRILFTSASPEVDFSTFYIPLSSCWRRLYTTAIRKITRAREWRIPRGQRCVIALFQLGHTQPGQGDARPLEGHALQGLLHAAGGHRCVSRGLNNPRPGSSNKV